VQDLNKLKVGMERQ